MRSPTQPYIDEHGVLHDDVAADFIWAVERENVRRALAEVHRDRVEHFARRIAERGGSPSEMVIVVLNVDDHHGGQLAEALMPGHDWSPIRARGETPFARGLAGRPGLQELFDGACPPAANDLRGIAVFGLDEIMRGR